MTGNYARAHDRKPVWADARLLAGGRWRECRILNISPGGAKVSIRLVVADGAAVKLDIRRFGRFGARVVWRNDRELGLEFTRAPAEMNEVVLGLALYG